MEVTFPHQVEYLVSGTVSVEEVIGTLQANQRAVQALPEIFEDLIDGLRVERAQLRVHNISHGSPLKEAFFVGLFLTYQKELEKEIPAMVEAWLHVPVDEKYKTIVTVAVMVLFYYGADYAYKRFTDHLGSAALAKKLDELISEMAELSGKTEKEVRRAFDRHLAKTGRMKEVAKAAIKFFRPSRNQANAPIETAGKTLASSEIADVPNQVDLSALDAEDHSVPFYKTRIELRAKDHDHDGQGWGGIVHTISEKRKPVRLYPNVSKDALWKQDTVWADILVTYRATPGGQQPIRYHVMKIYDAEPGVDD